MLCFCAVIKFPQIREWLICELTQLTPYSTAVLIFHGPFCNVWLDVSSSCGQNIVASRGGISLCDGSMCVLGDTVTGFCCNSHTPGCSRVRRPEFGPSHGPHPHSLPQSVCAIAVPFLKRACPKPSVWLKCSLFTWRVRSGKAIVWKVRLNPKVEHHCL